MIRGPTSGRYGCSLLNPRDENAPTVVFEPSWAASRNLTLASCARTARMGRLQMGSLQVDARWS